MSKHNFNRNFAIIIGINNYQNGIIELKTAVPDALKLAEIIQKQHETLKPQYQAQNKYEVQLFLNQRASLSHLKQLIADFKQGKISLDKEKVTVTESDRVLFYFAGHGIALDALENQDGPVGYLIPQDASSGDSSTYLPMQELHDALNALPCRHMLAILDCCFAGAFRWASLKREAVRKVQIYKERYDRFISDAAWQVITSAADDQKALDSLGSREPNGNEVHSPFAKALFDALGGEGADLNKDGIITATELYSYLRDKVEILTENLYKRQTPSLCPLRKHDKGEFIFLSPEFDRDKLEDAPSLTRENNPYRGLQSYDEKDSHLFFGRKNLIEKLFQKAVANKQALTLVLGASGTGKSSLMKAGLLKRLRENQEPKFEILDPMRPGESPLKALAQVCLPIAITITAEELTSSEQALANIIERWIKTNPKTKLLLAVDQFEELITLCKSDKEREQFLKLIKNSLAKYPDKIHVVITLRLDFEAQFQTSVLKDFWNDDTRFVVPPMSQNEFREAIEKPASEKVVYFDPPSLVDELINEVVQMPGGLPLLSFTLSELYLKYLEQRRDNRALTKDDYEKLGRVVGSITKRANQEYEKLVAEDSKYKDTVRRVMLRMISLQGGELARRQVPKSELVYLSREESDRVQTVIKRFSEARLIVEGSNPQGEPYVEPAHDALVQGWDKLLAWKKEEEENLILQRRLTPAAEEWKSVTSKLQPSVLQTRTETVIDWLDHRFYSIENLFNKIPAQIARLWQQSQNQQERSREKPVQFLWNGNPYLDVLNQELQSNNNWFNQLEAEFVQQSVLQKRRNISWRSRIAIAVMLGLSGLTIWALINLRQSTINQMLTNSESADGNLRSNQLILDALVDSLQAGESLKQKLLLQGLLQPKTEQQQQVIRTLRKAVYTVREYNRQEGFPIGVQTIFWNKEGLLLVASVEPEGTVRIQNKQGKQLPELPPEIQGEVTKITFSPDGSKLAIGTNKGNVLLWDWQNKQQKKVSRSYQCEEANNTTDSDSCAITSLVFSPDSNTLASKNRSAYLWNISNNKLQKLPQNKVVGIGFSVNGKLFIATTTPDERTVSLLDSSGKELDKFSLPALVEEVIVSPDDERLVVIYGVASSSGGFSLLRNWKQHKSNEPTRDIIVSFSRDGKLLATAAPSEGIVRLRNYWGSTMLELKGHQSQIGSLNFRSNNKVLATVSTDGTLRQWSLESEQPTPFPFEQLQQLQGHINVLAFSPDGEQAAIQTKDNNISLWDVSSGKQLMSFNSQYGLFQSLRFSPNGKTLATITEDGTVRLLGFSGKLLTQFQGKYDSRSNLIFRPDGRQLAVRGEDDTTILTLDVSSGKSVGKSLKYDTPTLKSLIWTPSNKILLASVQQDGRRATAINLLDLLYKRDSTIPLNGYIGRELQFIDMSFNNDGTLVATAEQGGIVSLWYSEGNKMGEFPTNQGDITRVILSPNTSILATIGKDGTAKFWQLGQLNEMLTRGCDRVRDYLQNNPNIDESDRHLCDNVPPTAANPKK